MNKNRKVPVLSVVLLLLLVICMGVGVVFAAAFMQTEKVKNTFENAQASIEVKETFNGTEKKNVYVMNTGSTTEPKAPAIYVRVKLLPYWYEIDRDHIVGKAAWTPSFTPGSDWVLKDGYYYYKKPIEAGEPTSNLISSITLTDNKEDGTRQVLEILADGVQAVPTEAVKEAWGINVVNGNLDI